MCKLDTLYDLTKDKRTSLFCHMVGDEEKKFYNTDTRALYYETFYAIT